MSLMGMLISVVIVVIVTFLILIAIRIPLYLHPLGKDSRRMISNDEINLKEAYVWRREKINEAAQKGEKFFLAIVGEFGSGMLSSVKYALEEKKFSVTVVSGNKTWCETQTEVISFLNKYPGRFNYYKLNYRPDDHFAIIGKSNLFIEDLHEYNAKIRHSTGITNAHKHILNRFVTKFEDTMKMAQKADVELVDGMACFLETDNPRYP